MGGVRTQEGYERLGKKSMTVRKIRMQNCKIWMISNHARDDGGAQQVTTDLRDLRMPCGSGAFTEDAGTAVAERDNAPCW